MNSTDTQSLPTRDREVRPSPPKDLTAEQRFLLTEALARYALWKKKMEMANE